MKDLEILGRTALRLEHPAGGCGILQEFASRPDGASHQIASAIGADAFELFLGAFGAEGAFIGTDASVERMRRQILVAIFTVGSKRQHRDLPEQGRTDLFQAGP